jgi:hypothetical protein
LRHAVLRFSRAILMTRDHDTSVTGLARSHGLSLPAHQKCREMISTLPRLRLYSPEDTCAQRPANPIYIRRSELVRSPKKIDVMSKRTILPTCLVMPISRTTRLVVDWSPIPEVPDEWAERCLTKDRKWRVTTKKVRTMTRCNRPRTRLNNN